MENSLKYRLFLLVPLWIAIATWASFYGAQERAHPRFDFFLNSNGVISNLQRETWQESTASVLPNDRILEVNDTPFEFSKIKRWLKNQKPYQMVRLLIERNDQKIEIHSELQRYTKNTFLIVFFIPLILSVLFLGFALGVASRRASLRKSRETIEVFSALCFLISLFFLTFLPTVTLGSRFSFAILVPIFGMMLIHLSIIYPKKKLEPKERAIALSAGYALAAILVILRIRYWFQSPTFWVHWLNIPVIGSCLLIALGSLGNTLLTSKDFWARRRARLLSMVFVLSFITGLSVFVAFVWRVPRISFERILAMSLFFPSAFGAIFLKSDVFDLERIFRRGLHQLLLLGMAITFALLLGLGWNQWRIAPEEEWMLWVAIAIVVIILARPVGAFFENSLHRLIQTRVRYPNIHEIFEASNLKLDRFLGRVAEECERNMNFTRLSFVFFQDPTLPWSQTNEQYWRFENGRIERLYEPPPLTLYSTFMKRGEASIGVLCFDGGDAIAFDPRFSRDWAETVRSIARCIEILCLQEFISLQQGFLAVGRMQSLLAHEMKNPLAIIKVCSGLLSNHIEGNDEAEELVKTIQSEVRRVSDGVQNIFEHSSKAEKKEKVDLHVLLLEIKKSVLSRFHNRKIEISFKPEEYAEGEFWLWTEKESFRQSLLNLLTNGFEAGSPTIEVMIELSQNVFRILVIDHGHGISEKVELFKPFVTTKPSGTGLGLAHVKAFVDRSNGQVRVSSQKGEGTTFVLEFSKQFVMNTYDDPPRNS